MKICPTLKLDAPNVTEAVIADALPGMYSCAFSYGRTALSITFCVHPEPGVNLFVAREAKNATGSAAFVLGAPDVTESVVPLRAEVLANASTVPLAFLMSYSIVPKLQATAVVSATAPLSPALTFVKTAWPR
jgi:hypothetical protein